MSGDGNSLTKWRLAAYLSLMVARRVLGIDVDEDLRSLWRSFLAPEVQPFFVDDQAASVRDLSPEESDTFMVWRVRGATGVRWLTEDQFMELSRAERSDLIRTQVRLRRGAVPSIRGWGDLVDRDTVRRRGDGYRFVWWPSLVNDDVIERMITTGMHASQHSEVDASTWKKCEAKLPAVRELAGTFPRRSEGLCFSAVMAAAGAAGKSDWVEQPAFEEWLARATEPLRDASADPGVVLVWRDEAGLASHAAVTIGDGWAFEKPSCEWWTPWLVARSRDVIASRREPGLRLHRYRLRDA